MWVSPTKNHRGKTRVGKNSEENLEKDSPYILLVIPGEGLHSMSPQVVVKLVHVQ